MIEAEELTKHYGAVLAVDRVSFSVEQGQILGLLGTNGAGKSTIMRMLTCFFPPSSGTARVAGFDVRKSPIEARRRIGYLPESVPLYTEMRVRPFLRFVAEIKGLSGKDRDDAVERVIGEVGLEEMAKRLVGGLSRGYRQRVGLAQAMVGDPEVLILDEPTVGLDPSQVVGIRDLVRSLAEKRTVILSTHILPEVSVTCQKVVIIHQGRLMAWGDPAKMSTRFESNHEVVVTLEGPTSDEARSAIESLPDVSSTKALPSVDPRRVTLAAQTTSGQAAAIAELIASKGWRLHEIRESGDALEDVFMRAISGVGESAS